MNGAGARAGVNGAGARAGVNGRGPARATAAGAARPRRLLAVPLMPQRPAGGLGEVPVGIVGVRSAIDHRHHHRLAPPLIATWVPHFRVRLATPIVERPQLAPAGGPLAVEPRAVLGRDRQAVDGDGHRGRRRGRGRGALAPISARMAKRPMWSVCHAALNEPSLPTVACAVGVHCQLV